MDPIKLMYVALPWVCSLLLIAACSSENELESPVFTGLDSEYAGDAVCFDCHESEWTGFQDHGMARSFYPLTSDNVVEDFNADPIWHEESGFWYRVLEEDGAYWQEEYRLNDQGERVHSLKRRMNFVIGSGNAARTYVSESNERLYELPLTWYSQTAQWDLSPGYGIANKRFGRLIPDRCMACHNSYPSTVEWVEGKYDEMPNGISCERCHGPGGAHVDLRLAGGGPTEDADYSIVNPARLTHDLQMDVCQQCHLHTSVSVLRDGRGPFDFRPSERLQDHLALFSARDSVGGLDVISHAERLAQSACYLASIPQMTCTTCHNPHEAFRGRGPEYFDNTCISCHEAVPEHELRTDCASCHMPKQVADGTPHATFTDHWIRVVEDEAPLAAHQAPLLTAYYDRDRTGSGKMEAIATLVHATHTSDVSAMETGIDLVRSLGPSDTTGEARFLMGVSLWRLGRSEEAIEPLEAAVAVRPNIPERLNALAQAYESANEKQDQIRGLYERALAVQPALADIRINYGRYLELEGDLAGAIAQYRRAASEKPWLAQAHYNLGTALLQNGEFAEAEAVLEQTLVLDPDHADALGNLGLFLLTENRIQEAGARFKQAVASAPENPIALSNLGSWYFNISGFEEAITYLERAVTIEPEYLGAWESLALSYARMDRGVDAVRAAERIMELDPNNQMAHAILDAFGT